MEIDNEYMRIVYQERAMISCADLKMQFNGNIYQIRKDSTNDCKHFSLESNPQFYRRNEFVF